MINTQAVGNLANPATPGVTVADGHPRSAEAQGQVEAPRAEASCQGRITTWGRAPGYGRCICGEPYMAGDHVIFKGSSIYCCSTCAKGGNPC